MAGFFEELALWLARIAPFHNPEEPVESGDVSPRKTEDGGLFAVANRIVALSVFFVFSKSYHLSPRRPEDVRWLSILVGRVVQDTSR